MSSSLTGLDSLFVSKNKEYKEDKRTQRKQRKQKKQKGKLMSKSNIIDSESSPAKISRITRQGVLKQESLATCGLVTPHSSSSSSNPSPNPSSSPSSLTFVAGDVRADTERKWFISPSNPTTTTSGKEEPSAVFFKREARKDSKIRGEGGGEIRGPPPNITLSRNGRGLIGANRENRVKTETESMKKLVGGKPKKAKKEEEDSPGSHENKPILRSSSFDSFCEGNNRKSRAFVPSLAGGLEMSTELEVWPENSAPVTTTSSSSSSSRKELELRHHFVFSTVSSKKCLRCQNSFSNKGKMLKCSLCEIEVHAKCLKGNFSSLPSCVQEAGSSSGGNLIAFINSRSGENQGTTVFRKLQKLLSQDKVFDLCEGGPEPGLIQNRNTPNLKVLVCGGDGSICWVHSVLDKLNWKNYPALGILPLGTGNDLSRTLGWGPGYENESLSRILNMVNNAEVVGMDRWSVNCRPINVSPSSISPNLSVSGKEEEDDQVCKRRHTTEQIEKGSQCDTLQTHSSSGLLTLFDRPKPETAEVSEQSPSPSHFQSSPHSASPAPSPSALGPPTSPGLNYIPVKSKKRLKSTPTPVCPIPSPPSTAPTTPAPLLPPQALRAVSPNLPSSQLAQNTLNAPSPSASLSCRSSPCPSPSPSSSSSISPYFGGGSSDQFSFDYPSFESAKRREGSAKCEKFSPPSPAPSSEPVPTGPKALVMNNYFSLGVDAQVALKFHKLREEKPQYFRSRFINKGWYGFYGMEGMIKNCGPLYKDIDLFLDSKRIDFHKDISGIIFLNISSYGGGTDPWGTTSSKSKWRQPSMQDGLLEVIGVTGTFHLGRIQTGLARGMRLGQASSVKLINRRQVPAQVDGEPWQLVPSETNVVFRNRVPMLARSGFIQTRGGESEGENVYLVCADVDDGDFHLFTGEKVLCLTPYSQGPVRVKKKTGEEGMVSLAVLAFIPEKKWQS